MNGGARSATLTVPQTWTIGTMVGASAVFADGAGPADIAVSLEPALIRGDADSNYCDMISGTATADPSWWDRRLALYRTAARPLSLAHRRSVSEARTGSGR